MLHPPAIFVNPFPILPFTLATLILAGLFDDFALDKTPLFGLPDVIIQLFGKHPHFFLSLTLATLILAGLFDDFVNN